jgi:thioredoxin reductase
MGPHGTLWARPDGATSIPGVYTAGDVSGDRQMILTAAAGGARAAAAINRRLREARCR